MDDADPIVRWILGRRSIKNKLVVLCEGDLPPIDERKPLSPQAYAALQALPDANFYKNCVPRDWHGYRLPEFFNCGGRSHVLSRFAKLIEEHERSPERSYLTPEKLYAIVDLDIQLASLPQPYPWATTEAVHEALYDNGDLKRDTDERHKIWVTALVHKEAFFILPSAASAWTGTANAHFRGQAVDLRAFHRAVAQGLHDSHDARLKLDVVQARLGRFRVGRGLSCSSPAALCASWLAAHDAADTADHESLLKALVSVAKVKPFWKEIVADPAAGLSLPAETFRDQLALKVAEHISDLPASAHPLAGFFAWLKPWR